MKRVTIIKLTAIAATANKPTRIRATNLITGFSIIIGKSYYYSNIQEQVDTLLGYSGVVCSHDSFDKTGAHYLITESDNVDNAPQHIKDNY